MYICENCQVQVTGGKPRHSKTISTRSKIYPIRYDDKARSNNKTHKNHKTKKHDAKAYAKPQAIIDSGGTGHEVVRQIHVCERCVQKL